MTFRHMPEIEANPVTLQTKIRNLINGSVKGWSGLFSWVIFLSVVASLILLIIEMSEPSFDALEILTFRKLEWIFTIIFTIEYGLRAYSEEIPKKYLLSFYGIIDLLSCLPTYLSLFLPGLSYFAIIRILRLFRISRFLKLSR